MALDDVYDPNREDTYWRRHLEGIEGFTGLIELEPKKASTYCSRAGFYMEMGQYQRAIQDCDQALLLPTTVLGEDKLAYCYRGWAYSALDNTSVPSPISPRLSS